MRKNRPILFLLDKALRVIAIIIVLVGLFFASKIFRQHYPIFFSEQNRICFIHRLSKAYPIIDLVLVLLDGGSWDLGTSYELINDVIINTLKKSGEGCTDRLLVAINQCDMVMKGCN